MFRKRYIFAMIRKEKENKMFPRRRNHVLVLQAIPLCLLAANNFVVCLYFVFCIWNKMFEM